MSQANETKVSPHQAIRVVDSLTKQFSPTSAAEICFPQQKFSAKLQSYLASYALTVMSNVPITDEAYSILEQAQEK